MAQPDPSGIITVRSITPLNDGERIRCPEHKEAYVLQMTGPDTVIGVCLWCHYKANGCTTPHADTCPACLTIRNRLALAGHL